MTHDELRKLEAAMEDNDDTVCCDIQMPVAQGRELLELVRALRASKAHPRLNKVLEHMQDELSTSIDIVDNPPTWGALVRVRAPHGRETSVSNQSVLGTPGTSILILRQKASEKL